MKKIFVHFLIAIFSLGCIPAYADTESSSSDGGGGGGGGGSGVGIAIGAAAVIGLLIWALSDKKVPETPVAEIKDPMASQVPPAIETESSNAIKKLPTTPSGGVGNVKSMEF
ncbi:hypothetical protein [Polynucleobacter sp. AM-25C3]|uniref:hypothetical protein n=1 Tax=Polynucleobacter sp. AM-25C3 TaxID=1855569 RepID=UPI001C0D4171|nr:hypothetical protein [Polynucleobacter sp. AM-25C3]MBU3602562.1 hypothetical protein [Polynucleobacter sp. AM-25C3]